MCPDGAAMQSFARAQVKAHPDMEFVQTGPGGGGYAKEMSAEWHAAANAMLTKKMEEVDIVITTALIPGKPAPKLWLKDMVETMKPGSVVVDRPTGDVEWQRPGLDDTGGRHRRQRET